MVRSGGIWPTSENFDFSQWCPYCPAPRGLENRTTHTTSPSPRQQPHLLAPSKDNAKLLPQQKNVLQVSPLVAAAMAVAYYGSDSCSTSQSAAAALGAALENFPARKRKKGLVPRMLKKLKHMLKKLK